ncbi:MAG TPA: hypothetical protein VGS28_05135 [Candidatus Saccharimonadales bacterium]|nr:hypothetical protein [Candidatus Saccharimonadales bacterium]
MPFLYGFLSFISLVFAILAFSRDKFILGWIGAAGFGIFMALTYLTL